MEIANTPRKKQRLDTRGSTASRMISDTDHGNDLAFSANPSFYQIPPTEDMGLEEFERFALDRKKVLVTIDEAKKRGDKPEKYLKQVADAMSLLKDIRKDVISHFALRLAYCKPNDRKWFITQETELLRFRLRDLKDRKGNIGEFLRSNNLDYSPIEEEEKAHVEEDLKELEIEKGIRPTTLPNGQEIPIAYFRVPFEQALDLVKSRKVILSKGDAFVSEDEFSSILISRFRNMLNDALAHTAKFIDQLLISRDNIGFLKDLPGQYVGTDYSVTKNDAVDINQIDSLSKTSFPLCMRNLHWRLRENHHLRHFGRMQYGLFLKGIGVTLDDALTFWRSEFSQNPSIGPDKFEKQYAYNIRHNYGQVGKRADYTPYSCMKIIMMNVGTGEHNGCPYKHFDGPHLKLTLEGNGLSSGQIGEISQLVSGQHHQLACRKHFELTHPDYNGQLTMQHPNQFYDESRKYYKEKNKEKEEKSTSANSTTTNDQNNNNNAKSVKSVISKHPVKNESGTSSPKKIVGAFQPGQKLTNTHINTNANSTTSKNSNNNNNVNAPDAKDVDM